MKSYFKQTEDFNEMVFENKNKSYGAYAIRKAYNDSLLKGFIIACGLLLSSTLLYSAIRRNPQVIDPTVKNDPPIDTVSIVINDGTDKVEKPRDPNPRTTQPKGQAPEQPVIVDEVKQEEKVVEKESNQTGTANGDSLSKVITSSKYEGNGKEDEEKEEELKKIYDFGILDSNPEFIGGSKKMAEFLVKNLVYPQYAKEMGTQGTVYVSFVVGKDGSISNISILRNVIDGCGEEAMRVVGMMPNWKPGKYKGKEVNVKCQLPIKFQLEE